MAPLSSGKRLKDFLNSHGDFANDGAPEEQVLQFELRYGIRIPDDFRHYLLTMNGTGQNYGYGILRFWELANIKTVAEEIPGNLAPTAAVIQTSYLDSIDKGNEYYVFADYLDESQLYAIHILPNGGPNDIVV